MLEIPSQVPDQGIVRSQDSTKRSWFKVSRFCCTSMKYSCDRQQPTVESVRAARQGKTLNLPLPGKGQRDCRLTNGARLMGTAMMVRHKPQSTQRPPHRTAGPPAPPVRPYPPPPSRNPAAAPANTRRVPRCAGSQRRSPAPAPAPVGCPPAAAAPPPTGTLSNRAPAPRRTAAFFGSDHRPARAA